MATLNDFVHTAVPATADIRKASVEQHRLKNRKKRYRNVNVSLIGKAISPFDEHNPSCERWNDRNKFKMPNPNATGGSSCQCSSCRTWRHDSNVRNKARVARYWRDQSHDTYDDSYDLDYSTRDGVDGVLYSYDRPTGPSHGSQILTQALDVAINNMERKQFELLVKNEYDIIDSEESASSEDDEYEFV